MPIMLGHTDYIMSAELGETRSINIYLPAGYTGDTAYPVVYLLDGGVDEDFIHIVGLTQFLHGIVDTLPPCIVVGICNTDRKRDYTYPSAIEADRKLAPSSGGSTKFISFIERELQPYVEKKYKTSTYKTLIGQSLGGLLATEILLKRPDLFNHYLIVSPSLWWGKEALLTQAPDLLKAQNDKPRQVFIAVGAGEEDVMINDAKRLADLLRSSGKQNIKSELLVMPGENHLTILHNAAYKGLEALFSGK